jgi:hypothetical protein
VVGDEWGSVDDGEGTGRLWAWGGGVVRSAGHDDGADGVEPLLNRWNDGPVVEGGGAGFWGDVSLGLEGEELTDIEVVGMAVALRAANWVLVTQTGVPSDLVTQRF